MTSIGGNGAALGRNLTFGLLDAVGRDIVTGVYDGKRFPTEAEMAHQNGVSRSVTREAMKMLTAKGLISAWPRKGTEVQPQKNWNLFDPDVLRWLLERKFSFALLLEFCELRLAIEPMAAELAARRGSAAAKAGIAAEFARMCAAASDKDDVLEADIAFHRAVLRAGGNAFYAMFDEVVATALRTSIRLTNTIHGHSASLPQHEAVLRAIERSDPDAARAAMQHIVLDVLAIITANDPASSSPR